MAEEAGPGRGRSATTAEEKAAPEAPAGGYVWIGGPAAAFVRALHEEGRQENADDVSRERMVSTLTRGQDVLYKPDYTAAACIDAVATELLGYGFTENLIKGWLCVSHNSAGKEQERLLLATTEALYRVKFNYDKREIVRTERTPWSEVRLVTFGPFTRKRGSLSLGGLIMKSSIGQLYGMRVHYRTVPDRPRMPLPVLADKHIDRTFRTFRPWFNPKMYEGRPDALRDMLRSVTHEMVFTIKILMRTDPATRVISGPRLQAVTGPAPIEVLTQRGLISAVHNAAGMGCQPHRPPAPISPPVTAPDDPE